jgi:hydroxyacylglutathione hydrolase
VLEVFRVPPYQENTYLVGGPGGEAVVVDPGGRVPEILAAARSADLKIVAVLNTHAHIDHVLGVADLVAATGAAFHIHPDAARMLDGVAAQAAAMGLPAPGEMKPDAELVGGSDLEVAGLRFDVRDTPGHAPGHVTLVTGELSIGGQKSRAAFCGDVIFAGSIGRTDLYGGDYDVLMHSITSQILTLPADTVLLPGHGEPTTVAAEAATNPLVVAWRSGGRL